MSRLHSFLMWLLLTISAPCVASPATMILPEDAAHSTLGRMATPEEVNAWNIDVRPDGTGLPPGIGSVVNGTQIYDTQCAVCHGVFGEGVGRFPALAGGTESLSTERPLKTIGSYWPYLSTVFDYVKRTMPYGNAGTLTDGELYAVVAYLLYLNDLVDENFELSRENFPTIALPNEVNFIRDNRSEEGVSSGHNIPCMSDCLGSDTTRR